MSDVMTTSRTARESLARALTALQADPNAPPQLIDLAAPIAQSMGALMQIEKTGQLAPHADVALNSVRTALSGLQQQGGAHPSVAPAMEAVASSLALVHNLWRLAQPQGAPVPAPPPAVSAPTFAQGPAPAFAQPQGAGTSKAPPAPPPIDGQVVIAELGTQSATNFYKGLSGNDIIDHGGLFVSTYMVPKIGTTVRLKVSLPGGYEFEANAVVAWSRDAADGGNDAPPGFGAKFTQITQEARQLIYRYVRNREPLFHDDL